MWMKQEKVCHFVLVNTKACTIQLAYMEYIATMTCCRISNRKVDRNTNFFTCVMKQDKNYILSCLYNAHTPWFPIIEVFLLNFIKNGSSTTLNGFTNLVQVIVRGKKHRNSLSV